MPQIELLPPEIIATIAAGEVIQRPVDVIKELIENSLDAQASSIEIHLNNAGLSSINIIDNGVGIEANQLTLAITPHATSKLHSMSDFSTLSSFGFRGEALASIAQVSQLTISSRTQDSQAGYQLSVKYGIASKPEPLGMPVGTQITITQLFAHSPVRQQFLSRSKSEIRLILRLLMSFALSYPHVGFIVTNNHKNILNVPNSQSFLGRTQHIMGSNVFSQLIPINLIEEQISIRGFVSQPSLWNKVPAKQFLFVNHRPINHKKLQAFINQQTQQLHANKYYPVYTLHIQVPPSSVDVNIHPQKYTIDLFELDQIKQALTKAIEPLLTERPLTYTGIETLNYQVKDKQGIYTTHAFKRGLSYAYQQASQQHPKLTSEIQQIANMYLLATTSDGLLLIDQHALHERILFDELTSLYQSKHHQLIKKQSPVNLVFDLDIHYGQLLQENWETFKKIGLNIDIFGTNSYKLTKAPNLLADHNLYQLITETLDQLEQDDSIAVDSQSEALMASLACKLAIKAGDYIDSTKRQELVTALLSNLHTGTCPHGRPVSIRITLSELNKLFKRS